MKKFIDTYPDFKALIEAIYPTASMSETNLSLFSSVCEEFIEKTGDDDLFFELQDLFESAQKKIKGNLNNGKS